jgi:hypothetical protein
MNRLLFAIRAIYHAPNPYHNYIHAIDVLQATYTFMMDIGILPPWSYLLEDPSKRDVWRRSDQEQKSRSTGTRRARDVMRPQDVFGLMIAAMGHDVGHPGLSNAFMVSRMFWRGTKQPAFANIANISRKTQKHRYQKYTKTSPSWRTCTACW